MKDAAADDNVDNGGGGGVGRVGVEDHEKLLQKENEPVLEGKATAIPGASLVPSAFRVKRSPPPPFSKGFGLSRPQ